MNWKLKGIISFETGKTFFSWESITVDLGMMMTLCFGIGVEKRTAWI